MKLITFTVPCYNSAEYMDRCINTLLTCGKEAEIIIVNDGSTDRTPEVADVYAHLYPDMVRVIHKQNGGHGSAVNAGIAAATGTFFKVVDSDDWLDTGVLYELIQKLRQLEETGAGVDLFVCNYVYDHLYENRQRSMGYKNVFPEGKICNWNQIRSFLPSQYLVMHALIFRTEVLRQSGVKLPEHTFYVDNIFAYQPLPYVKRIMYFNVDLYHYFLGREDQSVNEEVMKRRIDQQIYVTKLVSECVDLDAVQQVYPKLAKYMVRNVSIMMAISSIYLLLINTPEAWEKRSRLWEDIRQSDRQLYRRLRFATLSGLTNLPGRAGRIATVTGYRAARKIYGFC